MSRPMTFEQLGKLLQIIHNHHSPFSTQREHRWRMVKYATPCIDFRTSEVFAITFRGYGFEETSLHCQNECRALDEDLFDRCLAFLQGDT